MDGRSKKAIAVAIELVMDARERRQALVIGSGSVSEGTAAGKLVEASC